MVHELMDKYPKMEWNIIRHRVQNERIGNRLAGFVACMMHLTGKRYIDNYHDRNKPWFKLKNFNLPGNQPDITGTAHPVVG